MQLVLATISWCFRLAVLTAIALVLVKRLPPSRIVDRVIQVGRYALAVLGAFFVLALWILFMPHTPIGVPQERSRATLQCGELLLTQVFTASSDPYYVWLYFRPKGETQWTQYLVDFDAPYWWGGLVEKNTEAELTFYDSTVGLFRCDGPTFQRYSRMIDPARKVSDPFSIAQTQGRRLPPPFSF